MIDAFLLLQDGTLKRTRDVEELVQIAESAGEGSKLWLDLEDPPEEEFGLLKVLLDAHHLALEDCLEGGNHPKIDVYEGHLFVVFHSLFWDSAEGSFKTSELDCFIGPQFLVTYHKDPLPSIQDAKVRCLKREEALGRGTDYLLYRILDSIVDGYVPVFEKMSEVMEAIKTEALRRPSTATLDRLFSHRKKALELKQCILHQREILFSLSGGELRLIQPEQAPYFKDAYDHLVKALDLTDSFHEVIVGTMEAYRATLAGQTNRVIKMFTTFAALMIIFAVILGALGKNYQLIPEIPWRYGHYALLGSVVTIAVGVLLLFRWKKWF